MLKREITLQEAIGRTLEGIAFSRDGTQAALCFDGGAFATLEYLGEDEGMAEGKICIRHFGLESLEAAGIATSADVEAAWDEYRAKLATTASRPEPTDAEMAEAFRTACDHELTVQIGRLDGNVVIFDNSDDSIYVAERYEAGKKPYAAAVEAIKRAVVEAGEARERRWGKR